MVKRLLTTLKLALAFSFLFGLILAVYIAVEMTLFLPSAQAIKDVHFQLPLQIYSSDNKLIAEYGEKRREPITFEEIPKDLINAVLATEDQNFFQHNGVDISGLARAGVKLVLTGRKAQGGSTITMQVARNFYLSRHKTFGRKIREILLAIKMDYVLSKEKILTLYFNKIFLGHRSYGFAAASRVYYGKPLNELNLAQMAMLAGLPKSPSSKNPLANPEAAKLRRNYVLRRMLSEGYITQAQFDEAEVAPVTATFHHRQIEFDAPYVADMVRSQLLNYYGEEVLTKGWQVYTTIDSHKQAYAEQAVRRNVLAYDERHGFRGVEKNLGMWDPALMDEWRDALKNSDNTSGLSAAAITEVYENSVNAVMADGKLISIPWSTMAWARPRLNQDYMGAMPHKPSDILHSGDVVRVEKRRHAFKLSQIPEVQGAFIALNPSDGAILAMVGGFSFSASHFNRVTQAKRQPGSSFKPFIYSAALDKGYTLASILNDSPVVTEDWDNSADSWRPQNDNHTFLGPIRFREALVKSRNLASIRLLRDIGVDYAIGFAERFGFAPNGMPKGLSLALGSAAVTPMELAAGYAVFSNGGYHVTPYIIERITARDGKNIYQAQPETACTQEGCVDGVRRAEQVVSSENAFLMTSVLQDVIRAGTGRGALVLHRSDIAGKTGTTNDQVDTWFAGYNRDIVAVAWMGYDQPRSLREYGARAALPIWVDFMQKALMGVEEKSLTTPEDIVSMPIDPQTGKVVAQREEKEGEDPQEMEFFRVDHIPSTQAQEEKIQSATAALYQG